MGVIVYGAVIIGVCLYVLINHERQGNRLTNRIPEMVYTDMELNYLDQQEEYSMREEAPESGMGSFYTNAVDEVMEFSDELNGLPSLANDGEYVPEQATAPDSTCHAKPFAAGADLPGTTLSTNEDEYLPNTQSDEMSSQENPDNELCLVRDGRLQLRAWAQSGWTRVEIARELDALGYQSMRQVHKLIIPTATTPSASVNTTATVASSAATSPSPGVVAPVSPSVAINASSTTVSPTISAEPK